jgi:DNA-binding NarL/FixJ family response regulator
VVILDADLAGQDGLALIPRMAPVAAVLVLTSHGDPGTRARAGQLGALDFVEKHRPAAELFCAIERVARMKGGEEAPIPDCENSPPVLVTSSAAQSMRRP